VPIHEEMAYRTCEDGVGRWPDLQIAEWLGFERPRKIRSLVKRNMALLERHGVCSTVVQTSGSQGGRPSHGYLLNFEQAMKICTLSRTPKADDVCTVMIRVFSRVVNGISTEPRMELRVLEVAADRIVAPILREQREFFTGVPAYDRTG
jgi:hypothetical protein